MRRIKLVFLFIVGLYPQLSISQIIKVFDKNNLQPIENVMIFDEKQNNYMLTSIKGKADLSLFTGSTVLIFRHPSYETLEIQYDKSIQGNIIYLQESNIKILEIVISANKWSQNRLEIPAKITLITPKQVDFYNPQTSADLLGNTGEVFIQKSQQGGGSPMIRGFATNRVLITVDGIRMNTAIFRSGNLQNVISLDVYNTESTEIFFGPGSVMYGSDAIGGVMSFNTLTPALADSTGILVSGKTNARVSSANNEQTGHVDVNMGWEKWSYLSSFTYSKYGDLHMGTKGSDDYLRKFYVERFDEVDIVVPNSNEEIQNPSGYSQSNFMQKVRFKPNKKWDLNYGFHYSTTSNYSRYDRLIREKNGFPRSAEWYYGPQVWLMNNMSIINNSKTVIYDEITFRLAHQYFKESRHDRNFNAVEKYHNTEYVNALSANLDFHKTLKNKHQLFYGFESIYNDVVSEGKIENITTGIVSPGLPRYPQSDWSSHAVYATYNYEYSEKLRLSAGTRYNQFILNAVFDTVYHFPFADAKINKGALTGSLGAVYQPFTNIWLNTNLSTGFRSPNVDDMGKIFESGDGVVLVPNPELESEYAYNAEVGLTQIINDFLKYDIKAFYTFLNNAMVRSNFQLNGEDSIMYLGELSKVKAIQNGAFAKVYGIQAGFDIKFPLGFGFDVRFNYQKGIEEMEDGNTSPLRHAIPMFGSTHLTYSIQRFKLDFYAIYTAEISNADLSSEEKDKPYLYALDGEGNPYSPAWYTLNFKAMYQFNKVFSITTGIENITNERYRPYSSGITAAGRNYMLAAKANF
jgi:hemoglobin/transferrin/lactoferrin receptor protein